MIDHYYKRPAIVAGLRIGLLGGYVDEFARWLAERDYKRDSAARHIRHTSYLGRWLADTGRALEKLDEAQIELFIKQLPDLEYGPQSRGKYLKRVRTSMRLVLARLRADGLVHTAPQAPPSLPTLIVDFEEWMIAHRSVRRTTLREGYRPPLRRFLAGLGEEPQAYTAAAIRSFILEQAEQIGAKRVVTRLTPIRSFLRYLSVVGLCRPDIVAAIPRLAYWRQAALPRWISVEEVERIIAACDPRTPMGRRDRAVLLLMARLGLRSSDVGGLLIKDLDWAAARIWVCGKSRRREALPLPQDVGDALLVYLAEGRPVTSSARVFLGVRAPHAPLGPRGPRKIATRVAQRAGVVLPENGSHVLRHSLATALLADGMSLAGIGAVLRHTDLDTTRIYAKVDVATLQSVAPPWPLEVSP